MDSFDSLPSGAIILDASHYQWSPMFGNKSVPDEAADYPRMKAALQAAKDGGCAAIYFKATEGREQHDAWYPLAARAATEITLPYGAYHRFAPDHMPVANAISQAHNFLAGVYLPGAPIPTLPAMLDWENIGAEPKLNPLDAITWMALVTVQTGLYPLLYSSVHYLDEQTEVVPYLGGHQEWILNSRFMVASYPKPMTASSKPWLPLALRAAGKTPDAWQWVGGAPFPGFPFIDQSKKL